MRPPPSQRLDRAEREDHGSDDRDAAGHRVSDGDHAVFGEGRASGSEFYRVIGC